MQKSHLVDAIGTVAAIALTVTLIAVPSFNTDVVLYACVATLGAYAFVSFEVIPRLRTRRVKAEQIAAADRKVLRLPLPSEMENRHGEYRNDRRRVPALARVAGQ